MSTESGSQFGTEQSSDDDGDGGRVHTGALSDAVRETVALWGFGVLMVVFMGISLSTSVYTSVVYPAFFGLCAAVSLLVAVQQTRSKYHDFRFERTHDL